MSSHVSSGNTAKPCHKQDPTTEAPTESAEAFPNYSEKVFMNEASLSDKILFRWVTPFITKGKTSRLSYDDMGKLREQDTAEEQYRKFSQAFETKKHTGGLTLVKAMLIAYKLDFAFLLLLNLLSSIIELSSPFLIARVIEYVQYGTDEDTAQCYFYLLMFLAIKITGCFLGCHNWNAVMRLNMSSVAGIRGMIYNKCLKISNASNKSYTQGEIVNLATRDVGKISMLAHNVERVARLPFKLVFCLYILFSFFGVSFLGSAGVMLIIMYRSYRETERRVDQHKEISKAGDSRMQATTEAINNMKSLKFNAWEDRFHKNILSKQDEELSAMKDCLKKDIRSGGIHRFLEGLITISAFGGYLLCGHELTLSMTFTCISLLGMLNEPISFLPHFIGLVSELKVSMQSLQKFLLHEEIDPNTIQRSNEGDCAVEVKNGHFSWGVEDEKSKDEKDKEEEDEEKKEKGIVESEECKSETASTVSSAGKEDEEPSKDKKEKQEDEESKTKTLDSVVNLKEVDMKVKKGEFVCVIGEVGAGKTSLIHALIGDMLNVDPSLASEFAIECSVEDLKEKIRKANENLKEKAPISICGSMSLVQQQPWIQSMTMKENILFGEKLDEEKLQATIELCQLQSDIEVLPGGLNTEIGEKGINLSGG